MSPSNNGATVMRLPDKLYTRQQNLDQLRAIVNWYNSIPAGFNSAGDRFHENIMEYMNALVPDVVDLFGDDYYIAGYTNDGEFVFAVVRETEETQSEDLLIKIVADWWLT
jgi:hypothetical protein